MNSLTDYNNGETSGNKKMPLLTSPATGQWGLELGASENHFGGFSLFCLGAKTWNLIRTKTR